MSPLSTRINPPSSFFIVFFSFFLFFFGYLTVGVLLNSHICLQLHSTSPHVSRRSVQTFKSESMSPIAHRQCHHIARAITLSDMAWSQPCRLGPQPNSYLRPPQVATPRSKTLLHGKATSKRDSSSRMFMTVGTDRCRQQIDH